MSNSNNTFLYITKQEDLLESLINPLTSLSNNEILNIGIDFESYVKDEYRLISSGLDCYCNKLRLLSINWIGNTNSTIVVELNTVDITDLLHFINDSSKFIVWAHNAAFEIRQIKHHYNIEMDNIYCSMVLFNTLYVAIGWRQGKLIGSSLAAIMRHFGGIVMDKTLQSSDWSSPILSNAQLDYSASDVKTEWLNLSINVRDALIDYYQEGDSFELDQQTMRILAQVEYTGFTIDRDKMLGFIKELKLLSNDSKILLARQLNQPLSVELVEDEEGVLQQYLSVSPLVTKIFNNPKKLGSVINAKFKVNLTALNAAIVKEFLEDSGEDDDDDDDDIDLDSITNRQDAKEALNNLITYKRQEKLITEISKYESIINPITGALHATTNPVGAGTGRMSSASSIIVGSKKFKMNLQQVVARGNYDIRSGFIARPDYVIAGIDFSAQEVLTAMAYAKDEAGLAPFYEKKRQPYLLDALGNVLLSKKNKPVENPYTDPHCVAAIGLCSALSNYAAELIREMAEKGHDGIDYRFQGKILNFSVIYGKTEQGLSGDLKCEVEEAAKVLNSYFTQFFKLKQWLDISAREAVRNKRIKLPTGRFVWVDESNSKGNDASAQRKGPNAYVKYICYTIM